MKDSISAKSNFEFKLIIFHGRGFQNVIKIDIKVVVVVVVAGISLWLPLQGMSKSSLSPSPPPPPAPCCLMLCAECRRHGKSNDKTQRVIIFILRHLRTSQRPYQLSRAIRRAGRGVEAGKVGCGAGESAILEILWHCRHCTCLLSLAASDFDLWLVALSLFAVGVLRYHLCN